jgi:hypothetical protein
VFMHAYSLSLVSAPITYFCPFILLLDITLCAGKYKVLRAVKRQAVLQHHSCLSPPPLGRTTPFCLLLCLVLCSCVASLRNWMSILQIPRSTYTGNPVSMAN